MKKMTTSLWHLKQVTFTFCDNSTNKQLFRLETVANISDSKANHWRLAVWHHDRLSKIIANTVTVNVKYKPCRNVVATSDTHL